MAEFKENIKKDSKVRYETSQTIEKQSEESNWTQSRIGQKIFNLKKSL